MNEGKHLGNIKVKLSSGVNFDLYQSLKSGPVLINFIAGTWCPMCTIHMRKIRMWQEEHHPNSVLLIISPQPMTIIKKWQEQQHQNFLFISDPNNSLAKEFGVKMPLLNFPMPASFLIDQSRVIRSGYIGFKSKNHYERRLKEFQEKECA